MMRFINIEQRADDLVVQDCLIVNIAPCRPAAVLKACGMGTIVHENIVMYAQLPGLWAWIKIWWTFRHVRHFQ